MKFQPLITKMLINKDFSCYQTLRCCTYHAIKVKMPTIVGILTFISMINSMLSELRPRGQVPDPVPYQNMSPTKRHTQLVNRQYFNIVIVFCFLINQKFTIRFLITSYMYSHI